MALVSGEESDDDDDDDPGPGVVVGRAPSSAVAVLGDCAVVAAGALAASNDVPVGCSKMAADVDGGPLDIALGVTVAAVSVGATIGTLLVVDTTCAAATMTLVVPIAETEGVETLGRVVVVVPDSAADRADDRS